MADARNSPLLLERRRARRHPVARVPPLRVSILAGPQVTVIDVSSQGLLIETEVRLTPGAAICLNIEVNEESHLVGGRVARVDPVLSDPGLKYRSGIALDGPFPLFALAAVETPAARAETTDHESPLPHLAQAEEPSEKNVEQERELTRRRHALEEQRQHYEQSLAVIETLKEALRVNERSRSDAQEARKKERDSWERQRHGLEEALERARLHEQEASDQALAAIAQQRSITEKLEQERTAWLKERAAFQEELAAAKTLPEGAVRELEALREIRATLERSLDDKRATIANLVQEQERLSAELEALAANVDDLNRMRLEADARYESSDGEKRKLEHLVQVTETWCADQQELIYELAQQMLSSYARIQAWSAAERQRSRTSRSGAVEAPVGAECPAGAPEVPLDAKSGA